MKILWALLILITVSGIAQAAYINDEAFNQGNGIYLTLNQTTFDNLTCCSSNTFLMNISGNATTWTAGANKTITNPTHTADNFTFTLSGSTGWLNFSTTMLNASNSYNLTANGAFVESRNTTADKVVWFNYTGDATLSVTWNNSVAESKPPVVNGSPAITSNLNNHTNNAATSFTADINEAVMFSAGANQSVTWTWTGATEGAGDGTANSTANKTFTSAGVQYVNVSGNNTNGTTSVLSWTVTVSTEGGGGGTNWDYLTGSCSPNGATITTNPNVGTATCTLGAYSFGYVFDRAVGTYWINITKTGYTANNTQITFNEDHEVWNVDLVALPTSTTTWWNSKTNDDSLVVHVNGTESVEFGLGLATITTAVWTLDNSTQSETSANFTTSLNSLGVHSLSAYGNIPTGITQTVTWKLLSTRVKSGAGDETALLNNTWFDGLTNSMNGSSPDFTQFIGAVVAPYTTQLGALFYVFIYLLPLVIIWIRQEKVLISSGLLGIFGIALLPMLPEEWRLLAGLCVILTSFGIVYSLFKEKG